MYFPLARSRPVLMATNANPPLKNLRAAKTIYVIATPKPTTAWMAPEGGSNMYNGINTTPRMVGRGAGRGEFVSVSTF